MRANLFQQTAQFYDLVNSRDYVAADIPFYKRIIQPKSRVLEVGCGTGRVAIELAQHGCDVTGMDLSEWMLDEFRKKLARYSNLLGKVTLCQADMVSFDLGTRFDWIIFPFRVFQALTVNETRQRCLDSVRRHTDEETRVVITLFNPRMDILAAWGKKGIVNFEVELPNSTQRLRRIENQMPHDAEAQVIALEHIYQVYDSSGVVEEYVDRLELGYLFPEQAQKLFCDSGFVIEEVYGGYDFEPLTSDVRKEQIYILKR
jgi:ubiquinone/menaquinone biosynthesis C-methylase UbiE